MKKLLISCWSRDPDHDWGPQSVMCAHCRVRELEVTKPHARQHGDDCPLIVVAKLVFMTS